jgi:4-amino-4-deoxychorismate lyase
MWLNGQPLLNSPFDRGLQFGDGHFTTLVIRNSQCIAWPFHQQRLLHASSRLYMAVPDFAQLQSLLKKIALQQPNCVVKIIITRANSERGYGFAENSAINWYVTTAPLPTYSQQALAVEVADITLAAQPLLAGLKTLNRLEQVLLSHECKQRGCDELLVADQQNQIIEGISSNIFCYDGEHWITPQLEHSGVKGIMREALLSSGALGEVIERPLAITELAKVQQMFFCNSVLGPRPVASIQGRKLRVQTLPEVVNAWYLNDYL